MVKIKAIIFDMDGVLIDAKDWHYESLNRALNLFGYAISRNEHLTTYDGLPTRVKLDMLSIEKGLPKKLHDFISTMKQIYTMEMISLKCKPIFQHEYALSKLKENGLKLGLASNAVRNSVESMLNKSDLMKYMDFVISNEDVEKSKPDPEIYIKAMAALGVSPEETMILEDNDHGIRSAKAAGGFVMEIETVEDVYFTNIMNSLEKFEERGKTK
jgi:beta-phosphoglucomutase